MRLSTSLFLASLACTIGAALVRRTKNRSIPFLKQFSITASRFCCAKRIHHKVLPFSSGMVLVLDMRVRGQKGIAHLIEHMLFKGTEKLSETDIKLIGQKFSASWNASTSYDYTNMVFEFPIDSWQTAFPILADCMRHCSFKQELLNSELKVVIQELKMGRDNHIMQLFESLLSAIYPGHPYHYPVIGYKHDLYNVSAQTLKSFYRKHYVPNNATLVVVGNVLPSEVVRLAEEHFGHIPADPKYKSAEFPLSRDLKSQAVTLYRDIQNSVALVAFAIPGTKHKNHFTLKLLDELLTEGRTSRLRLKLVESGLANTVKAMHVDLVEQDMYIITFSPISREKIKQCATIIQHELDSIATNGFERKELERAAKRCNVQFYTMLEDNSWQADFIGQTYLATRDEHYIDTMMHHDLTRANNDIKQLVATYFRPIMRHGGGVLPLPEKEKAAWQALQLESDTQDTLILNGKTRECPVENGRYVHTIQRPDRKPQTYVQPQSLILKNGLRVLYHHKPNSPLVRFALKLKADQDYEPADKPGIFTCLADMLQEEAIQSVKKHTQAHKLLMT